MEYALHIIVFVGLYVILSVSLNLIAGYTGLLSIAHAAFYGVGAYVGSLLALRLQTPFLVNLGCAAVAGGLLGAIVGFAALRLRDDYFVIATLAFQVITVSVFNNWSGLTRGPLGISGIPEPAIFGWRVSSQVEFVLLVGALCALTLWVLHSIVASPLGRVLKAIREDEVLAQARGKNVGWYKLVVLMIGAGIAAIGGAVYACYIGFVDPTSFTIMESIFLLSIVIIGGAGSLKGSLLGAVALATLPELLRFVGMPSSLAANVRQILYGAVLVVVMMWRPQGLLGQYAFEKSESLR